MARASNVADLRGYRIRTVEEARSLSLSFIQDIDSVHAPELGLPEIDDRYHVWRVPVVENNERIGEIVLNAKTGEINQSKSSSLEKLKQKLTGIKKEWPKRSKRSSKILSFNSAMRNVVMQGDSEDTLLNIPAESVGLAFTSPPYYNARPDYSEYVSYEEYLLKFRKVTQQVHRVLAEGRFFVINVSPVLIRRTNRGESSKRIAVPFDIHRILTEEGFDFIDDIHWVKPSGAGWATGRGRRFAADRTPLQYKAVPVTEYVLVYRKHTDKLIDWNIRNHYDQDAVSRSKISDDYEATNLWRIHPAFSKVHPAIFPVELAERVIKYYSFENDIVLDPFAGIGTTGEAAIMNKRKFILSELEPKYIDIIRDSSIKWLGKAANNILCIGCRPIDSEGSLI